MDLSKFTTKNKGGASASNSDNAIKRSFNKVRYWLLPPTSDKRKQRVQQYKDLGIFIAAVALVAIFEDKIKNFLEIETDQIRKMSMQGAF